MPLLSRPPLGSRLFTLSGIASETFGRWLGAVWQQLNPTLISSSATDGFTLLPTTSALPTGVPNVPRGAAATVFDATAHRLWIYDGAAWRFVDLT